MIDCEDFLQAGRGRKKAGFTGNMPQPLKPARACVSEEIPDELDMANMASLEESYIPEAESYAAAVDAAMPEAKWGRGRKAKSKRPQPSCKAKAVDLLARSDQSVKKLTEKLKRRSYDSADIEETIEWLQEKHYIDDEAGCGRRFEYLYENSSYSVKQIVAKLQQQGYDRSLVMECIPEDTFQREYEKALKALRSKCSSKDREDIDSKKMLQWLYGRGFNYEVSRCALEDVLAEKEE